MLSPPINLPSHSPLGASGAERWMHCPGSVELIRQIVTDEAYQPGADPEYRRDGTEAHALAALCLDQELDCWEAEDPDQFPHISTDMMTAVQEYLDHVRAISGERVVEHRVHLPDFHPMFFGTLDCAVLAPDRLHVIDYKHGAGVVVEVERNPQVQYYAYGLLQSHEAMALLPDNWPVRLTIVQPRGFHPEGGIRSWDTTVGEIKRWAVEELRPAMELTQDLEWLHMGEWCRFCPAKLVCPALDGLGKKAIRAPAEITYQEAQQLKMLVKAIEEKAYERLLAGKDVEGAKLVRKRADRTWKENAEQELLQKFGRVQVYQPVKLKSPKMIEDTVIGGKDFVAEWAYTPEAGYTVAPIDDKRREVKPETDAQKYGDPAKLRAALSA